MTLERLRTQRQTDGHLMRALRGRKGNDAVDAQQSQQHSRRGEARDQGSREATRSLAFLTTCSIDSTWVSGSCGSIERTTARSESAICSGGNWPRTTMDP